MLATRSQPNCEIVFGTYRLKGEVLDIATAQAIRAFTVCGIANPLVDTAMLYNNAAIIESIMARFPHIRVCSKVHRAASVKADLEKELSRYGDRLYRVLLHKYMPDIACYLVLVEAKANGLLKQIGVSNYTSAQLRELIEQLTALDREGQLPLPLHAALPDVVQNELHPFVRTSVPELCHENGIRFEAHSVFSFLDQYPEDVIARVNELQAQTGTDATPLSAAQIAMAFALQRGGGNVVFNTANYLHLSENMSPVKLSQQQLDVVATLNVKLCRARYSGSDMAAFDPRFAHHLDPVRGSGFEACTPEYIRDVIATQIRSDLDAIEAGAVPSNVANGISRYRPQRPENAAAFAALADGVFIDDHGTPIRFYEDDVKNSDARAKKLETLLTKIRKALQDHIADAALKSKPKTCKYHALEDPEALPVDIPDPAVLQPFIDLVASTKQLPETAIRMGRGTLFPDGRLDFCKQVSQPSFDKLCDAVLQSGAIKHFLIGNNVALVNDTDGSREAALGRLIRESRGVQTWYLAGNGINRDQIKSIAESLAVNPDAKYVWLKMNPIQDGSYHLGRLTALHSGIEVIDLFNTGQGDAGVAAMLRGITDVQATADQKAPPRSGLRHLYLDINGITNGTAVAQLVAEMPQLESLSVNVNKLGDVGLKAFVDGFLALPEAQRAKLVRFVVGSNGITDASLPVLVQLVKAVPTLVVLQLSSYKSTNFFQQSHNNFTSADGLMDVAKALSENAAASVNPQYNFFGFQNCYTTQDPQDVAMLVADMAHLGLHVNGSQRYTKGLAATITSKALSTLLDAPANVQPPPVEFIQSVYRNAM